MRKELGKWLMDAALFVTTVLVFQVLQEAIANLAVAVLLGIATAAICLAAGLWLLDDTKDSAKDKDKDGGYKGRSTAIRAGVRKAKKARKARRARNASRRKSR